MNDEHNTKVKYIEGEKCQSREGAQSVDRDLQFFYFF